MVDGDRYHSNILYNRRLLEACPKTIYRQIIKAGREPHSFGNGKNTLADVTSAIAIICPNRIISPVYILS